MIEFRIQVIVEPDGEGFHAYCPALKGLHTCGDTEAEALQNAKDAAMAYLKSSLKHGDAIPLGIIEQRNVEYTPLVTEQHLSYHTEDLKIDAI